MPVEIERKFLVTGDGWRGLVERSDTYRQGYLSRSLRGSVRVRRCGAHATLTVKGPRRGITRDEYEFPIPVLHAVDMLRRLCPKPLIEKVRHCVTYAGMTWQVDEYQGAAAGLILAEIELTSATQAFALPDWIGAEVTGDRRYRNSTIPLGRWRASQAPLASGAADPGSLATADAARPLRTIPLPS